MRIGLVPTMGALHDGHLSLVRYCKKNCDITVVSIFVNPTQFNNDDDYAAYPNTLTRDLALLQSEKVEAVFTPDNETLYPRPSIMGISFNPLDSLLEGAFRPGHFSGVALVVSKLFNIVNPDTAFFGQKDLQQVAVIKKLNEELAFGIEIETVPTQRATDGLALSSRNSRLTDQQRHLAPVLYKTLAEAKRKLLAKEDIGLTMEAARGQLEKYSPDIKLEYLEIVDSNELTIVKNLSAHNQVSLCIAAYFGEVRLIDNLFVISR